MGVNLYDSPAQATFINTYVPIQFDSLYKISDRAQKNLEDFNALQEDVQNNYSHLNTVSDVDRQNYGAKYGALSSWVEKTFTDPESIKDPIKQAAYKAKIRQFKSDNEIRNMMDNSKALSEYAKNSDPRWGNYELDKARTFDSRNGTFNEKNMPYKSNKEIFDPIFDKLHPGGTFLYTKGAYDYTGWTSKETGAVLDASMADLMTDPYVQARLKAMNDKGELNQFADANGNIDQQAVIKAMAAQSRKEKEWTSRTPNPLYMKRMEQSYERSNIRYRYNLEHQNDQDVPNQSALQLKDLNDQSLNNLTNIAYNRILNKYATRDANGVVHVSGRNPWGNAGAAYASARVQAEGAQKQFDDLKASLATATGDHKKEIEKSMKDLKIKYQNAQSRLSTANAGFLDAVEANRISKERTVIDPVTKRRVTSGYTSYDLLYSAKTTANSAWVGKRLSESLGDGETVSTSSRSNVTLYPVRSSNQFSMVDPNTGSRMRAGRNTTLNMVMNAIKDGVLDNHVSYEGSSTIINRSDEKANVGYMYISKSKFKEITYPAAKDEDFDNLIGNLEASGLVEREVVKAKNLNNNDEEFIKVPVSKNIGKEADAAARANK